MAAIKGKRLNPKEFDLYLRWFDIPRKYRLLILSDIVKRRGNAWVWLNTPSWVDDAVV